MEAMPGTYNRGQWRTANPRYTAQSNRICSLSRQISRQRARGVSQSPEMQEMTRCIKAVDTVRKTMPSGDPLDTGYRRLRYCRYAEDIAIGLIGPTEDARDVMDQVNRFLTEQ